MESLLFSLGCVLPLFVLILIGYILRRLGMINDNFVSVGTKVVFNVSLPVQLFVQIASSDLTNVFNPKLILFSLITLFYNRNKKLSISPISNDSFSWSMGWHVEKEEKSRGKIWKKRLFYLLLPMPMPKRPNMSWTIERKSIGIP